MSDAITLHRLGFERADTRGICDAAWTAERHARVFRVTALCGVWTARTLDVWEGGEEAAQAATLDALVDAPLAGLTLRQWMES